LYSTRYSVRPPPRSPFFPYTTLFRSQLMRFSEMCGAEIPRWVRLKLASFGDDTDSIKAFGLDVVTGLCERLLAGGAPGLHFYSLDRKSTRLNSSHEWISYAVLCLKKK